jgi:MoaA/NifB/PqqE/SkfB family radical SAM enzyme
MSRLALLNFVTNPTVVVQGLRKLGLKGAVLHGLRRASAAAGITLLGPCQIQITPLGVNCNQACPMCWHVILKVQNPAELERLKQRDREEIMTLEEYEAFFAGLPWGVTEIHLVGGGEPLAYPHSVEIMRAIKRRGLRGNLTTNGSLLKDRVADAMVDVGWDHMRVSVHAGDAPVYRTIHAADHFERVMTHLKHYDQKRRAVGKERRCSLSIVNVIQRENIENIPRMFEFAEEVGADDVIFELITPFAREQLLDAAELARVGKILNSCKADSRIPVAIQPALFQVDREEQACESGSAWRPASRCSVGYDSAHIGPFGDVTPCCLSTEVLGNVRQQPFRAIWRSAAYQGFRKRLMSGQFADYCISNRCKLTTFLH